MQKRLKKGSDSFDVRILKCLDGLVYSFQILDLVHEELRITCARINSDRSALIPALWRSWSFVDVVHRIRELAQALPGLGKKKPELRLFLDATDMVEKFRHYMQHLRSELSKKKVNPFPVWGSLGWVDPADPTSSYLVLIGAAVETTSYTGCVFDTVEGRWVSTVCLAIDGLSLNIDPIYEACIRFREFVLPWTLSVCPPEIKFSTELPIVTAKFIRKQENETYASGRAG